MSFSVKVYEEESIEEFISNFSRLTNILISSFNNFSTYIESQTRPYVPYDTGVLEDSFFSSTHSKLDYVELDVGYSAITEDGFDYAIIQHEVPFHHKKKGIDKYLVEGIHDVTNEFFQMVELDYLSFFRG